LFGGNGPQEVVDENHYGVKKLKRLKPQHQEEQAESE